MDSKFETYNGKQCFVMSRRGGWTIMATLGRAGRRDTPQACRWLCKRREGIKTDVFIFATRIDAELFASKHADLRGGYYRTSQPGSYTSYRPLVEAV
ncbi:MAG: hypothetical protein GY772_31725 [bacterium]|nr:hypothetical protein [bacterium]